MTVLLNSFTGGSDGVTITTGNSGGASGNAFDSVSIGTGATLQFSATRAAHGTVSCQVATAGTSTTAFATWAASEGTQTTIWFRVYCYLTGAASPAWRPFAAFTSTPTHAGSFFINGTAIALSAGASFTTPATFTTPAPLNQWFRFEGSVTGDPSAGAISGSIYLNMDSLTATETQSATGLNTTGVLGSYRFGQESNGANAGPFWMDDIGLSSAGPLGPFGYPFYGHFPLYYLDYLDTSTGQTLVTAPGGAYLMVPANPRQGLTVPPPDGRWNPGTVKDLLVFHPHSAAWDREAHLRLGAAGPQMTLAEARAAADPATPPPLTADAVHGHYPGSRCAQCDPLPAEPEPVVRRVDGPDFAPGPSLAQVRAAIAESPLIHSHYTPCRCEHCMTATGGM